MSANKPIPRLQTCLKYHIDRLRSQCEIAQQDPSANIAPIRDLISFYEKTLMPKLTRRSPSNVFTDILLWEAPRLFLLLRQVGKIQVIGAKEKQEKEQKQQKEEGEGQEEGEEQNQEGSEAKVDVMPELVKMPIKFVSQSLIPWLQQIAIEQQTENQPQGKKIHQLATLFTRLVKQQLESQTTNLPNQQFNSKITSLLYTSIQNTRSRITIKYAYRFLFIAKLKLRVKQANKHIENRRLRIMEFIEGQKKYINGLIDYIQYIKNPICQLNILTDLESKKLFSTIQSILGFHRCLEQQLSQRFVKYHKYQTYGDLVIKNIPFFKLYTDYIQYADTAQTLLIKLQQNNEDVKAICNKFMLEKQKKASDELKQPTFRIARYGMIMAQILKNTSSTHPDYPLLKQAQKQIATNLTKINQTVDEIARRTRLHQLEQQFGTEERPIYTKQRIFIEQFHLKLIKDDQMQPIFMFIFNDMIIIIDQSRKILHQIAINSKFYARRQDDNKTYRNIVKIHTQEGFLTLTTGNQDKHYTKAQSLYKILKSISKNNIETDRMVNVHVIGTQEINSSSFNKFTEYIAEINYIGLRKFIRIRFSLMKPFVQKMQEFYKNDLGIYTDGGLKDGWFTNYSSKTIQDRKRVLQQILQKMLNNPIIQNNPAYLLNQLGIQPSFFKSQPMTDRKKNQILVGYQQLNSPLRKISSISDKQIRQAETILCATQIKLGRDSYHDPQYINKKVSESQRFAIKIYTAVGNQPLIIRISDLYTVEDVCYEVSALLELKTSRDFRLFHEVGKKQLRVLDNDKKIIKLFSSFKKDTRSSLSFSQILQFAKSLLLSQPQPKVLFKKYYFLPTQIQHSECKKDINRLRLIVYQIFSQIKDMKYNLNYQQYLLYLAILIYIQYDGDIPEQICGDFVRRIIPDQVFKIRDQDQQFWFYQCRPHLIWLKEEISKIIQHNQQKVINKKIRANSAIHFGHRHICSQLAVSKIRANSIYGSNLFYVQLSKQTYQKFEKAGKKPIYNMWLAIKVTSLLLISPTSKQTILQVQLKNIQKIVVETQGLIFKIQSLALCEYNLNTYQSFQISQLVKYYKCLNQTIQELESNKNLMAKTRVYKQELDHYRMSYEKAERQTMAVENTKETILEAFGVSH